MTSLPHRIALCLAFALGTLASANPATADEDVGTPIVPPGLEDVGITEHLDGPVPPDAIFRDETGKQVRIGDYFDGRRPVVLTLAYHTCPTVCSMVLSQTVEALRQVNWSVGKDYQAITLSFDPHESLERTQAKRASLLSLYGRPGAETAWPFLTGDDTNIHRVTDAVGFHYHYVAREQQFAHPTVIMLLKPDGHLARYLYGLDYSPNDVRLGLLEASKGHSITTIERILLYCYHYDPQGGKYVLVANRVMQVGGGISGLALCSFLGAMWLRERRKNGSEDKQGPDHKQGPAAG